MSRKLGPCRHGVSRAVGRVKFPPAGPMASGFILAISALLADPGLRAASKVIINEIQYHPGDDVRESEFVELYNHGSEPAELGGWILSGGVTFVFPAGTRIDSGAFLLVAADRNVLVSNHGVDSKLIVGNYSGSLSNDGERIELWTDRGYLMSFVDYSDADPWPEAPDGLGPSLERISSLREETDAGAWAASIQVGGTPGAPNSVRVEDPVTPGGQELELVPEGATWSFFRGRSEPSGGTTDWAAVAFGDAGWESGPAGFGYDDNDDATILSDMRGGYSTVYVRRKFQISDPADIESLTSSILYDDGYVAYLNGVEVDRINVAGTPGTPVAYNSGTPATVEPAPRRDVDLTSRKSLLVAGTNVFCVQGVNNALDNADFSLHPSLQATLSTGLPTERTFIEDGAEWRFFRGRTAPPADWAEPSFVEGDWELGLSGFGYGDNDDNTVLSDMEGTYLTVFVRKGFQVADATKIASLTLTVNYDDGFIAYLNGVEVARANVAEAGFDKPASGSHEAGTPVPFDLTFGPLLRTGLNVLAIEGHNGTVNSTDFSLAPSLRGMVLPDNPGPLPDPPPVRPPRDVVINEVFLDAQGAGWIELYNTTGQTVDLSGRRLEVFPSALGLYEFPPGSSLPGRDHLLVTEAQAGFPLTSAAVLVFATAQDHYIDAINPRTAPAAHSTGRWHDGADNRYVFSSPTPEGPNSIVLEDRVVINEVMFHPGDANTGGEFIELHNRSTQAVDISGWSFTRGVEYTFPAGTVMAGGGFLVIAETPAAAASYYGIPTPLGPYEGKLANDAETLLLRDALKNTVDRVRFADEGTWPETADGEGPSAELVHPRLENRYGPAWAASAAGGGTPGAANSRRALDPPPIVVNVEHAPVVPTPSQDVVVTATISDERSITSATLFWQNDGGSSPGQAPMLDDGVGDDGVASNGVYGARIPARADKTIVVFWIQATAEGGQTVTEPAGAPAPAFLYQVEASGPEYVRPRYRIVMKAADLSTLRTRDRLSDVLLDCTFVADGRAYHNHARLNRGVRYRGRSARNCNPLSYRVQFDHDQDFHGIKRLDINGCNTQRQWIGLDFLGRTGLATPQAWFRKLCINGTVDSGNHLRVEAVDEQFIERNFPAADEGGNIYRGDYQATLEYRNPDVYYESYYVQYYLKHSNEDEADWSDVVDLCHSFDSDTTPAAEFPATIEATIDIHEWALYFAAFAALGSTEGNITLDTGDDYYIYRRPSDGRWIILPWDLDASFDQATQVLFRPTIDQIERFLEHPRYAPLYWCYLETFLGGAFKTDRVNARIDHLTPLFNSSVTGQLRTFASARYSYINSRISPSLTASVPSGGRICGGTLIATQPNVSLSGLAPGCGTTEVRINGDAVSYNPQTNQWSGDVTVSGTTPVSITALDRNGLLVARRNLTGQPAVSHTILPSSIASPMTLVPAQSPYRVVGATTVQQGASLAVEPGVTVVFDTGASLVLDGPFFAAGTPEAPITLTTDECGQRSEGIVLRPGSGSSVLSHVRISGLFQAPGHSSGIVVEGAAASLDHIHLSGDGTGTLLEIKAGSLVLEDSFVGECGVGVLASGGRADVRRCDFRENGVAAIKFSGGSTGSVESSVFREDALALAVTRGASVELGNLTVFGCGMGLDAREEDDGGDGGTVTAHSLIVWQTPVAVGEDGNSSVSIAFSDVAGAAVRPGQGNINADPRFLAPGEDLRLSYFSPCRGTGMDGVEMGAFPYVSTGETGGFLRCDVNGDGDNDLSDAVYLLLYLFEGGRPPPCPASTNCNADGITDMADVIFDLQHLFLAGPAPPPPYPDCERVLVEECPGEFCAGP